MKNQSNPNTVVKAEPLTAHEIDQLLKLLWLRARIADKARSPKKALLGDLLLIKEIVG